MEIQTLSILVPPKGNPQGRLCINDCPFCVSKLSDSHGYINQIEGNKRFLDLYERDFKDRLIFARDNGCNTIILTGDSEPLQNQPFLIRFADWNDALGSKRFYWIELQTTGIGLDDEMLRFLRNKVRVSTISLSVVDLFNDANNCQIIGGASAKKSYSLLPLCSEIKRYDFSLRLSINLVDLYNDMFVNDIVEQAEYLGADQLIFRVLYTTNKNERVDAWINEHRAADETVAAINEYIKANGKPLEVLPFGATRYSLHGMSIVLDDNCMPQEVTKNYRYLVLRPNCKLYSRWDDKASLVF